MSPVLLLVASSGRAAVCTLRMPERPVNGRASTLHTDSRKLTTGLIGRLRATFGANVGSLVTRCIVSNLPSIATV